MYTAQRTFIASGDPGAVYHPGDPFPRAGVMPAPGEAERLLKDGLIAPGDLPESAQPIPAETEPAPRRAKKTKKEG